MPERIKSVATILGVIGAMSVFEVTGLWLDGVARVPVTAALLLAAALLFAVRRPWVPPLSTGLAAVPPVFGTGIAIAVSAGWRPVDLAVSMTDQPLSESPSDLAPYVLYVGVLVVLAVWTARVLRREDARAYYAAPDAPAA